MRLKAALIILSCAACSEPSTATHSAALGHHSHSPPDQREARGAHDDDGDGLDDGFEASPRGQDLGAHVGRKDIFFHVDWRYCSGEDGALDPARTGPLSRDEIRWLIRYFRDEFDPAEPWCVHVDNGETIWDCDDLSPGGDRIWLNEGRRPLAKARAIQPFEGDDKGGFDDARTRAFYFPEMREGLFYYGLRNCGSSGWSGPSDVMPWFGNSGSLMLHEFGHKWGLGHGFDVHYAPNYWSVMSYPFLGGGVGFTHSELPPLNERAVCESDGLRIPITTTEWFLDGEWFEIPQELVPLARAGLPAKLIRPDGAIDWNHDGVVDGCTDPREANVDLQMGNHSQVRDTGDVIAAPGRPVSLVESQERLYVLYADNLARLMVGTSQTRAQMAALREQLLDDDGFEQDMFSAVAVIDYDAGTHGKLASAVSAVSTGDGGVLAFMRTTNGSILQVRVELPGTAPSGTMHGAVTVLADPGSSLTDPSAAMTPHGELLLIARDVDSDRLRQFTGPGWTLLPHSSNVRPAIVFDSNGDALIFAATDADPSHGAYAQCAPDATPLYVLRMIASGGTAFSWVWDDNEGCRHVSGAIGAIFDPSPTRSIAGRVHLFHKSHSSASKSWRLLSRQYDLHAQTNDLGLRVVTERVRGKYIPFEDTRGAGSAGTGIMFDGRALMAYVQVDTNDSDANGRLVFSPFADGVNKTNVHGRTDFPIVRANIPIRRITHSYDGAAFPVLDRDADGVLDFEDSCPDHFNPDGEAEVCDLRDTAADMDGDGIADRNDTDRDGDGYCDAASDVAPTWCPLVDNCPGIPNPSQEDGDGDGIGNPCDEDSDGDGVLDIDDGCPHDPSAWTDEDGDGVCEDDPEDDNCVLPPAGDASHPSFNPDQRDTNGDGVGDACETGLHAHIDGVALAHSEVAGYLDTTARLWGAWWNLPHGTAYTAPIEADAQLAYCVCDPSDATCSACVGKAASYTVAHASGPFSATRTGIAPVLRWSWLAQMQDQGLVQHVVLGEAGGQPIVNAVGPTVRVRVHAQGVLHGTVSEPSAPIALVHSPPPVDRAARAGGPSRRSS